MFVLLSANCCDIHCVCAQIQFRTTLATLANLCRQSQGGRLAISERRRTSQSQSRDPQSGKSQSRNRAQSTIGAQTTQGASWYLGVRRWPRIGHTGSEMGVDRSGGQYRSCGTEIHKMTWIVVHCTNMYKCTQMGLDRCGG